jgi:RNA polymerase sigma-70 factor (ECF subfamily)
MADLAASPWSIAEAGGQDAELVSAIRAGSQQAFDELVARYHTSVYNVVYRMVGDPADAADTVQEVFLKVYRGIDKFQGNSSLKTWVFRIAVHEGCNFRRWWRRHRWWEQALDAPAGPADDDTLAERLVDRGRSPFDDAVCGETRQRISMALEKIPESYRTAVVLRDLEDCSYEEIGEILGVSLGTVKSRVARGREALRTQLLEAGLGPAAQAVEPAVPPPALEPSSVTVKSR